MKHGRLKELKLGLAAGNTFRLELATVKGYTPQIYGVRIEAGVVKVDLGKSTLPGRVNHRWQELGNGDVVRCSGELGPIYKAEDLAR